MVLIASCACSMESIVNHSDVWGKRSWFIISILSSDDFMEVRASAIVIDGQKGWTVLWTTSPSKRIN